MINKGDIINIKYDKLEVKCKVKSIKINNGVTTLKTKKMN